MARIRRLIAMALLAAAPVLLPGAAAAQESNLVSPAVGHSPAQAAGWTVTPAIGYSGSWDDNALMQGVGSPTLSDFVSVINPRGFADFNGRKGSLSAGYEGGFLMYRQLQTLNSYEQHGWISGRRRVTPHVVVFASNTADAVPTTELAQIVAVPFVRIGARIDDLRSGIEAALTKHTSVTASFDAQWVAFDRSLPGTVSLRGGHGEGGFFTLSHQIGMHTTLIADSDLQHVTLADVNQAFDVQNVRGGVDYKLSNTTHVFAAAGVAHLNAVGTLSPARSGPALRAGLVHQFQTAALDLLYSRSFVPSYGFGGATENEEVSTRLRLPLTRHITATSSASWRRDNQLTTGDIPLRSVWLEGSISYAFTPMVRVEAFYNGTHQNINRPGGTLDRNRVGFMVITAKPVRIH